MKNVFAVLMYFFVIAVHPAAVTDVQSMVSQVMKKDGMLLVRNDVLEPYEVRTPDIGKTLICLSNDLTTATLYPVTERTFPRGEPSVLVRCADGLIDIGRGYI